MSNPANEETGVAFIGTRRLEQVPTEWLETYSAMVAVTVRKGWPVRTGAAPGADQHAAYLALKAGGYVQLVLPWRGYEKSWVDAMLTAYGSSRDSRDGRVKVSWYHPGDPLHEEWAASVARYHPNPAALTAASFALHARNYGIVKFARSVVALPHPGRRGGTEQGLRVAMGEGLHSFVLSQRETRDYVKRRLANVAAG